MWRRRRRVADAAHADDADVHITKHMDLTTCMCLRAPKWIVA